MTTIRLLLLRCYGLTFGRIPAFSFLLKKLLIKVLIRGRRDKYVAATKYFDSRDLQQGA